MTTVKELPVIHTKKKINLKRFVLLAEKVRKSFEMDNL